MAVSLPNGIVLAVASAYAAPLTVTAATNASETVLTVTNTLVAGDYVVFVSGWTNANNRVFRVKTPTGTTVVLEGLDTTLTSQFPASSGTGTIAKISTWTQVSQIIGCTSSGGDPQYQTYSFLESNSDYQIPTTTSAQSLSIEIAYDPALAGYQAVKTVSSTRATTALRATLPQGGFILYNGIFAMDETPSMTKGNLMSVKISVDHQSKNKIYTT